MNQITSHTCLSTVADMCQKRFFFMKRDFVALTLDDKDF